MKSIRLYHLYVGIFFLFLTGCTSDNEKTVPETHLDKNILTDGQTIRTDTLNFPDTLIYAKEFLVYQDSILIAVNNKHKDGYFIEFYKLPDIRPITRLYRLGDGPDEMLSAKTDLNGNKLIVNDYIKSQVAVVNIDSILSSSTYSVSPARHQAAGSPTAVPYKDIFLLENPYSFIDKDAGIVQNEPRFIITDGKQPYIEKEYKYYTRNVAVNGRIIVNEAKNRIIYANMYKSSIEIYDMELNLLRKIEGPIELKPQYAIEGNENGMYNVSFREHIPYAYLDYYADESHFYLSYVGNVLGKGQNIKNLPNWIFKFDWNGNFIKSYPTNCYVLSFTRSKTEKTFYITTLSAEDTPILIRLYED